MGSTTSERIGMKYDVRENRNEEDVGENGNEDDIRENGNEVRRHREWE